MDNVCVIDKCQAPVKIKKYGLCGNHYMAQWRSARLGRPLTGRRCARDGCPNVLPDDAPLNRFFCEDVDCQRARDRSRGRDRSASNTRAREARQEAIWKLLSERPCKNCGHPLTEGRTKGDERLTSALTLHPRCRSTAYHNHQGLTGADIDAMLLAQGGRCAIPACGAEKPGGGGWHIDHDHACCPSGHSCEKCRRGLLCAPCNMGLGQFRDDVALLRSAADYLDSHPIDVTALATVGS